MAALPLGCIVHVSCAVCQKLLVRFLFNLGNLVPKQSRVWQICGAACYRAYNLCAVQLDFVISWKHMDLNEDFENARTEVLPVVC